MISKLTTKGQVTLPKICRDKLELLPGDKLDFVLLDNGVMHIVPIKQKASKLKGLIPRPAKPVSIDEMNQAIAQSSKKK